MGLCKCPKRQVTNQFCFEHRVNVCENCMVTSHPKCIVQSYINWLKDSDYVSLCSLCNGSLEDGDCVRLICYHIFHWDCLNERQSALSISTGPEGHTCPLCFEQIFPPANLVSPVADILKEKLKDVSWSKDDLRQITGLETTSKSLSQPTQLNQVTKIHQSSIEKSKVNNGTGIFYSNNNQVASNNPHSVLLMDAFNPPPAQPDYTSRRSLLSRQQQISGHDRDDNKYRRRTPAEIFSRWSRRFYAPSSRPPWRRTWFLVLSGIIIFFFIIYLMAFFGRSNSSNNDSNDYWENPKPMPVQNNHY